MTDFRKTYKPSPNPVRTRTAIIQIVNVEINVDVHLINNVEKTRQIQQT